MIQDSTSFTRRRALELQKTARKTPQPRFQSLLMNVMNQQLKNDSLRERRRTESPGTCDKIIKNATVATNTSRRRFISTRKDAKLDQTEKATQFAVNTAEEKTMAASHGNTYCQGPGGENNVNYAFRSKLKALTEPFAKPVEFSERRKRIPLTLTAKMESGSANASVEYDEDVNSKKGCQTGEVPVQQKVDNSPQPNIIFKNVREKESTLDSKFPHLIVQSSNTDTSRFNNLLLVTSGRLGGKAEKSYELGNRKLQEAGLQMLRKTFANRSPFLKRFRQEKVCGDPQEEVKYDQIHGTKSDAAKNPCVVCKPIRPISSSVEPPQSEQGIKKNSYVFTSLSPTSRKGQRIKGIKQAPPMKQKQKSPSPPRNLHTERPGDADKVIHPPQTVGFKKLAWQDNCRITGRSFGKSNFTSTVKKPLRVGKETLARPSLWRPLKTTGAIQDRQQFHPTPSNNDPPQMSKTLINQGHVESEHFEFQCKDEEPGEMVYKESACTGEMVHRENACTGEMVHRERACITKESKSYAQTPQTFPGKIPQDKRSPRLRNTKMSYTSASLSKSRMTQTRKSHQSSAKGYTNWPFTCTAGTFPSIPAHSPSSFEASNMSKELILRSSAAPPGFNPFSVAVSKLIGCKEKLSPTNKIPPPYCRDKGLPKKSFHAVSPTFGHSPKKSARGANEMLGEDRVSPQAKASRDVYQLSAGRKSALFHRGLGSMKAAEEQRIKCLTPVLECTKKKLFGYKVKLASLRPEVNQDWNGRNSTKVSEKTGRHDSPASVDRKFSRGKEEITKRKQFGAWRKTNSPNLSTFHRAQSRKSPRALSKHMLSRKTERQFEKKNPFRAADSGSNLTTPELNEEDDLCGWQSRMPEISIIEEPPQPPPSPVVPQQPDDAFPCNSSSPRETDRRRSQKHQTEQYDVCEGCHDPKQTWDNYRGHPTSNVLPTSSDTTSSSNSTLTSTSAATEWDVNISDKQNISLLCEDCQLGHQDAFLNKPDGDIAEEGRKLKQKNIVNRMKVDNDIRGNYFDRRKACFSTPISNLQTLTTPKVAYKTFKTELADEDNILPSLNEEEMERTICELLKSCNQIARRLVDVRQTVHELELKTPNLSCAEADPNTKIAVQKESDNSMLGDYLMLFAFMAFQILAYYIFVKN